MEEDTSQNGKLLWGKRSVHYYPSDSSVSLAASTGSDGKGKPCSIVRILIPLEFHVNVVDYHRTWEKITLLVGSQMRKFYKKFNPPSENIIRSGIGRFPLTSNLMSDVYEIVFVIDGALEPETDKFWLKNTILQSSDYFFSKYEFVYGFAKFTGDFQ